MAAKKGTRTPERSDLHRPTSDDWRPNFPDGTVRVSFLELSDGQWRVCVWGNDDLGMERDYAPTDREAAHRLHALLAGCSDVTRALCTEIGMTYC